MFVNQDIIHTNTILGSNSKISYAVNDVGLYAFALNSALSRDIVSNTTMPSANYTTPHWEFNAAGELIKYETNEYVKDRYGQLMTYGGGTQLCLDSEDAGEWQKNGTSLVTDTGETISCFKKIEVKDGGTNYFGLRVYQSTFSGQPSAKMYGCLYYIAGTSGKIRITCANSNTGNKTTYVGVIGSAVITDEDAGIFTVLSDRQDDIIGCRVLKFTIEFINYATDSFNIYTTPYSTDNSSIFILGADVFDTDTYRPHVPSQGSTVVFSSTYADTTIGPRLAFDDMPLMIDCLDGLADGVFNDINFAISVGSPIINGNKVSVIDEVSSVVGSGYWVSGIEYEVSITISNYLGSNSIIFLYDGSSSNDINGNSLKFNENGTYTYRYKPTNANAYMYSYAGHTATVTVNYVKQISPAKGELEWQGMFYVGNEEIVSGNSNGIISCFGNQYSLLYTNALSTIISYDQNNIASRIVPWKARIPYKANVIWGEHSTLKTGSTTDESFTSVLDTAVTLTHKDIDSLVTPVVTTTDGVTTYTEGSDYTIDYSVGTITVLSTGTMADATEYYIDYTYFTGKFQLVVTDGITIWKSSIKDFDGSFNPVDYIQIGFRNTYPIGTKSLKFRKLPKNWA